MTNGAFLSLLGRKSGGGIPKRSSSIASRSLHFDQTPRSLIRPFVPQSAKMNFVKFRSWSCWRYDPYVFSIQSTKSLRKLPQLLKSSCNSSPFIISFRNPQMVFGQGVINGINSFRNDFTNGCRRNSEAVRQGLLGFTCKNKSAFIPIDVEDL